MRPSMFQGTVERTSHEGGLLIRFTGAAPALGTTLVTIDDDRRLGRVDTVLGHPDGAFIHLDAISDGLDPQAMVGRKVRIRPRRERQDRTDRPDRQRFREQRPSQGGDRNQNDWECSQCRNSNFGFRTECNRCGAPRNDRSGGRDRRPFDDRRNPSQSRNPRQSKEQGGKQGDWECPQCQNLNFSFRTECNRCGMQRSGNDERRAPSRSFDRGRGQGRDRPQRGRDAPQGHRRHGERRSRNDREHGSGDWTCSKCNNSNFAFRQVCNRCEAPRSGNQAQSRRRDTRSPRTSDRGPRDRRPARTHGTRPSNDGRWMCQCGKSNDGRSRTCKKCGKPKGRQGGYGGRHRDDRGPRGRR